MSALNTGGGIQNFARSRRLSQQHLEASPNFSEQPYPSLLTPIFNLPNLPFHQPTSSNFPWQQHHNSDILPSPNDSRFLGASGYLFHDTQAYHRHKTKNPNIREGKPRITNGMQHHTMLTNCVGLQNTDAKNFTLPSADTMTTMHTQSHTLPDWPPALNCSDYSTKFWDFEEWKMWSNSTEGHGTIKSCGSVPFLEDASGDPLTSANVDAIHRTMRRLFEMLASKDITPLSWGCLSEQAYLLFHIAIGTAHPELGEQHADDLGFYAGDDDIGDDLKKKWSAPENLTCTTKRYKPSSSSSSVCITSELVPEPEAKEPEHRPSLVTPIPDPMPPPQCNNETQTSTTVSVLPQITLKNPLDSIIRPNCFPPVTAPLPSPALISTGAAVVSQPDTHIQEPANEPPNLKALVATISPATVTNIPDLDDEPTPPASNVPIDTNISQPIEVPKKGSGKARASSKKNGRDLCLLCWLKQIRKEGSSLEFCMYWDALDQQQRNSYDSEAKELSSSKTWVKNTVLAVVNGTLH
ncbi:hypothetical protein DFH29DRAFT_1001968 [Suillus ampliporus]|nr:hypothetical protein DFH29DRAFT_1001968 [Suillus ampliporus]